MKQRKWEKKKEIKKERKKELYKFLKRDNCNHLENSEYYLYCYVLNVSVETFVNETKKMKTIVQIL